MRSAVLALFAVAALTGCVVSEAEVETNDAALEASLADEDGPSVDRFPERIRWIASFAAMAASCVDRVDALDGQRALFHGCYDWHSSVHAHWAVLRAHAVTGEPVAAAAHVAARLSEIELHRVAAELRAEPTFELPYGRAWLLALVSEHASRQRTAGGAPSRAMEELGAAVAAGLVADFDGREPDARRADYRSDAWTLAQLIRYQRATGDRALGTKVDALVASFAARPVAFAATNDHDASAFFSAFWSYVYVVALAHEPARVLELVPLGSVPAEALEPLPDPNVRSEVHHLGINWSRAWGIKALARAASAVHGAESREAQRLVAAYHAHVRAGRARHTRYRGDYYAYDHWVPQFAIYAITD